MKRILAASAFVLLAGNGLLGGSALGQSFNVDLNNTAGLGAGVPSSNFGGAAGQRGSWNSISGNSATISSLADLNGNATGVTFTRATNGTYAGAPDVGATGDAAKLLLDYDTLAGAGMLEYSFNNLSPGWYVVYTYAVRPNADTQESGVKVFGSQSAYQYVGGNLANSDLLPDVTHAVHIYYVLNGFSLRVQVSDSPHGPATCNGIQIKKIGSDDRIRYYVDKDATGPQDGTSWATAFKDLQTAVVASKLAIAGFFEIWTAQGFYYTTSDNDRNASFVIGQGLHLYGGFQGNESSLAQRTSPWAFITAMSGSIGGGSATDNAYHVVDAKLTDSDTIIDGFSIAGGYANGSGDDAHGGGILLINAGAHIQNCKFLSNTSGLDGGAVYARGGESMFSNCLWYNNTCTSGSGGAIYAQLDSTLSVYNGDFRKNYAAGTGGAVATSNCSGFFANCFFDANNASFGNGGAFYTAGTDADDTTFANCTFSLNHSGMVGGGMYVNNASDVTLNNCILWGNNDATGASASAQQRGANGGSGASITSNYTTVQGISPDPQFVNATGNDGVAGNFDDDCSLQIDSPCIDAGNNNLSAIDAIDADGDDNVLEFFPYDLDKNPRFRNVVSVADTGVGSAPVIDRGCFEYQPCGPDFDGDGFLTGIDFDLFVQAYESGDLASDWDGDGFITGIDFDLYTQAYEAGC